MGLDFRITCSLYMIQTSRGTYNKEKNTIIQDIFKPSLLTKHSPVVLFSNLLSSSAP